MKRAWLIGCLALVAACAPDAGPETDVLVIQSATLFDSRSGTWLEDTTLVIEGERITAVGAADAVAVPRGAQIIDATGQWVVPGFIDVHVHHADDAYLRTMLAWGVTSIHVMPHRPPASPLAMEQASEAATTASPRLQVSQMFTGEFPDNILPGVYAFLKPTTDMEARSAVRMMADNGYRQIKIIQDDSTLMSGAAYRSPVLDPAVFAALIGEARDRNMRVYVHAMEREVAEAAIAAGAEALLHGVISEPMPEADWQRMAALNAALTPAIHVLYAFGDQRAYARLVLADGRLTELMSAEERAGFQTLADADAPVIPPANRTLVENTAAYLETTAGNLQAALAAGVPLAVGSDGGPAGASTHLEMGLLQDAGLTPAQGLTAATWGGAVAMGREADVGSLEVGKYADLVILETDPTNDIRNARAIQRVLKGGKDIAF